MSQFIYLLNAFETASQHDTPAEVGYAAKRKALLEYVEKLESARPEALCSGWQPIEGAPKDRNIILTNGKVVSEGGWLSDLDVGAEYEGQCGMAGWWSVEGMDGKPTHWQPMPSVPSPLRQKT